MVDPCSPLICLCIGFTLEEATWVQFPSSQSIPVNAVSIVFVIESHMLLWREGGRVWWYILKVSWCRKGRDSKTKPLCSRDMTCKPMHTQE
jgi:hypothetical protein